MKLAKYTSLGVGVLAVPERRARVMQLVEQLDLSESTIAWDTNHDGHMPNWWRAVEAASRSNPSHVLILEDDAEPCQDFLLAVEKILTAYPDRIISFFSVKPSAIQSKTISLVGHYGLSDVAVVYPRLWLEELRADYELRQEELAATQWHAGGGADEMRMKLRPLTKSWSVTPGLVQHGCPGESTLGHNFAHSTSPSFIGAHTSALMLDWSQL